MFEGLLFRVTVLQLKCFVFELQSFDFIGFGSEFLQYCRDHHVLASRGAYIGSESTWAVQFDAQSGECVLQLGHGIVEVADRTCNVIETQPLVLDLLFHRQVVGVQLRRGSGYQGTGMDWCSVLSGGGSRT